MGNEVIGYTNNRASHAEYVLVEAANLTAKPAEVPWEVAGALFVAGVTGVATVRAVAPTAGEAVVIAGAGGGVGVFAVQLAVRTGARVIAVASERHHAWLRERGAVPVAYGDGVRERITAAAEKTSSLRTGLRPSKSLNSERLTSQSEYQDAQSASVPSVMRKTWWWVSPASLSSSEMRSMSVMDSTLHLALTRCPRERG
ncbi:MAG: hypothetical protein E6G01_14845 [Actinobacteria bacterium]|nr:MAG: hypothetical protein E6G01_14845 [Actinomycetota bacterium]